MISCITDELNKNEINADMIISKKYKNTPS
jgi:hypothetical protein